MSVTRHWARQLHIDGLTLRRHLCTSSLLAKDESAKEKVWYTPSVETKRQSWNIPAQARYAFVLSSLNLIWCYPKETDVMVQKGGNVEGGIVMKVFCSVHSIILLVLTQQRHPQTFRRGGAHHLKKRGGEVACYIFSVECLYDRSLFLTKRVLLVKRVGAQASQAALLPVHTCEYIIFDSFCELCDNWIVCLIFLKFLMVTFCLQGNYNYQMTESFTPQCLKLIVIN